MCISGPHTLVIIVGEEVQTRYNVMFFDEADDDSAMKKPLPRLFLQFWSISSSRVAVMPHVTRNSRKDWKHPAASQMSPASTSLRYRNCSKQ